METPSDNPYLFSETFHLVDEPAKPFDRTTVTAMYNISQLFESPNDFPSSKELVLPFGCPPQIVLPRLLGFVGRFFFSSFPSHRITIEGTATDETIGPRLFLKTLDKSAVVV